MDADGGGVKKRKAEANATLRKKPRRSGRDKSEFVSMEVGMREFKKRLAASGSKDADTAAAGANAVENLTQDVKKTRTRVKPKTEATKTAAKKATAAVKKAPVKKTVSAAKKAAIAKKSTAEKKTPVKRTTRAATGMTLAEVKAQLEREQKERVEYRIQTLRRDTKPAAAPASAVLVPAATSSISVAPELVAPVASPVHIKTSAVAPKTVGKSDTQAYTPSAPPTASLSAGAAPASSAVPPSNPVKNEFIADDMEEDLMFAMALEEVERKLATPQKPPPSSEAVAATDSNSLTSVNLQAPVVPAKPTPAEQRVEIQPTQSLNATQPQPTETVANIKQPEPAVELSPEVLEEMERLRRENELLRRSNELLQAAVTSPVHAEAPVDEKFCRSPEVSTAHDSKNESAASPKDNISRSRSTARYLDLARCDSDQDMKQTVSACDQIPDRIMDRHSSEKHQHKPTTDKEAAAEQQIHTDNVSVLSSAVTLEAEAPSMQLPDHSTPSEKDSPVQPIATEQEADLGKEIVPTELSPSKRNVDEHSFHATAGSDGDVSDVSMSENDGGEEDEDDPMEKDGSAPRIATIDSGNYTEYKVHQEDELEADEDEYMEESPHDVSEDKVNPAPAPLTPVDSKRCETVVVNEPDGSQSDTPANSEILERTTAPSNSDDDEEDAGEDEDEFMVVNRVKRREVMAISSSSSSSESELEEDEADDTPSSNVLEAALKAAGSDSGLGGKSGPGGKGGSGASDQICVLIRAQQRDRDDAVENFGVLTELCLSNQRASNWRWSMQQVHNTTTSAREFQAVKAISFFSNDLKQVLLRGQIVPTTKTEKESVASCSMLSPRLLKYLHKHYNDSQLQAILGCLGEDSRVIIQGPPGTGKTKTILGLLSALLDGAGLSTLQKTKGTARIRVGASLQNARTSAVSRTVAETSIRVLVAAPSNAAVDELVLRVLSEGLYDGEKGESYRPRIVRVGRPESSQQLFSLAAAREASESKKNRKKMRKYAREVEEVLLESLVTKHRSTFPTVKQARQAIIKNAQIVFCTLSGAGSVAMCEFAQDFDALIIDEAAQAVEASTLIPFKFRPHRVMMVGDHRQLPATVISKNLVSMGYDRSLQQRLVENGSPVLLLNQQYRMHPEISEFPSTYFYDGRLVQNENMREWTAQDYHRDRAFKPLLFLDVQGAQSQVSGSTSLRNLSEVEAVIQLVRRLLTKFPRIDWKKRIGVIAPYKQQIYEVRGAIGKLEAEFERHLGIEVNTVDGFQGREKEIIIYSCVRTSYGGRRKKKKRSRGNDEDGDILDAFWADERRMNVAITRAKSSLWIVGNSTLLKQSRAWRALIQHTKDHSRYISDGAATLFASSSSTRKTSKTSSKSNK
ncbi:hypothetical protein PC116_g3962 [Phytophthora cactorum]|nr:hypothetical protein PC116_g3962 [Phytophthora cactorum]